MPLRLFWGAPRTSPHAPAATAETRPIFPLVRTTGDYPGCAIASQIDTLFCEFFGQPVALRDQFPRHVRAEGVEEFLLRFEFLFPLVRFDREQRAHRLAGDVELGQIKVLRTRNDPDLGLSAASLTFAPIEYPLEDTHVFPEA